MKGKRPDPRPILCTLVPERNEPMAGAPGLWGAVPLGEILSFPDSTTMAGRCPQSLLAELLALNEEMIEQLHAERLSVGGTADFALRMVAQHEKAAALLRVRLAARGNEPG